MADAEAERSRTEWIDYYLGLGDLEAANRLGLAHDRAVLVLQARVRAFLKLRQSVRALSGPELVVMVVEAIGLPKRVFGASQFVAELGGGKRGAATSPLGSSRAQWMQSLRVACHPYHGYGGAQREPGPAPMAAEALWPAAEAGAGRAREFVRVRVLDLARRGDCDTTVGLCYVHIGDAIAAGQRAREAASALRREADAEALPPLGEWVPLWLPRGRAPVGHIRLLVASSEPGSFARAAPAGAAPRPNVFEVERRAAGLGSARSFSDADGFVLSVAAIRGLPPTARSVRACAEIGCVRAATRALAVDGGASADFGSVFHVPRRLPAGAAGAGRSAYAEGGCIAVRAFDESARSADEPRGRLLGGCVVPLVVQNGGVDGWFALSPPPAAAAADEQARAQVTGAAVRVALRPMRGAAERSAEPVGGALTLGGVAVGGGVGLAARAEGGEAAGSGVGVAAPDGEGRAEVSGGFEEPGVIVPRLLYALRAPASASSSAPSTAAAGGGRARQQPAVQPIELTGAQLRVLPPAMAAALAEIRARQGAQVPTAAAAAADSAPSAAAPRAVPKEEARGDDGELAGGGKAAPLDAAKGEGKPAAVRAKASGNKGNKNASSRLKKGGRKARTALFF